MKVTMNAQSSVQLQALWWKPRGVVLEGTTLRPLAPLAPYNPFAYHYPHSLKDTTRATKSLCYEFLRVKTDDQKAVADFCCRYGVLGRLDNPGWIMWGMEKSGSNDCLKYLGFDEPSPLGLLHEHDVRGARLRQIAGMAPDHSLCVPMEWDDFRRAQAQLREATVWVATVTNKGQSKAVKEKAQCALRERFRWKLTMVRPYLSWDTDGGNWALAWDIGSLEAAMYLMLLLDVHGGGPIRTCQRCRTVFLGTTRRARFCSTRCLNTDKVRRFRAKRKREQAMLKGTTAKEVRNGPSGR
jgi:hypothetical protein